VKKYCRIHEARPVADVEEIVVGVLMNGKRTVSTQLPQTGDSWSDLQSWAVVPNVALDEKGHLGPRADERHLAQKHVKKLWRLI